MATPIQPDGGGQATPIFFFFYFWSFLFEIFILFYFKLKKLIRYPRY
jgi:hypothetical protein